MPDALPPAFLYLLGAYHGTGIGQQLFDAVLDGDEPALADEPAAGAAEPAITDSSTVRKPDITKFPYYPALARRERIEGAATVCFKVAPDGRILEAKIASSTHEVFEKPALEAIRASTFEPLTSGQELVPTVCRTYRFRLDPVVES